MNQAGQDEYFMALALDLARRGEGRTSPNPMVGAVVVRKGRIAGEGYHESAGAPHAEVVALKRAGAKARGATLYVTLEPCTHYGRTPPCVDAIRQSGLGRIVVAAIDPNPLNNGKGIRTLREYGFEVTTGVLEDRAERLNEAFIKAMKTGLPFVTVKMAVTLDGKTAARTGDSKWISSEESKKKVQKMRFCADGVLAGIGTVLEDDPRLTVRLGGRWKKPELKRIVVDSRLRIPPGAKVLGGSKSTAIIVTSHAAPRRKAALLEKKCVTIIRVGMKRHGLDIREALEKLLRLGIQNLLVEGGSRIAGSFLRERLADRVVLFIAPKIFADGKARGVFEGMVTRSVAGGLKLRFESFERLGSDIMLTARPL